MTHVSARSSATGQDCLTRPNLKSFKFEVGDSYKGALGMALRVWATTKQQAVGGANRFLEAARKIEVAETNYHTGVEYCTVYFGANLKLRQIVRGEEIEEVSPELAAAIAGATERHGNERSQSNR